MKLSARLLVVLGLNFLILTASVQAQLPGFDLPVAGDRVISPAAGNQNDPAISQGDTSQLLVWGDTRSNPYGSFEYETSSDIYAARLDVNGNLLDPVPFAVTAARAGQANPKVAWNGSAWLVVFETSRVSGTGFFYQKSLAAVRIAADGSVLDAEPIPLHGLIPASKAQWALASDGDQWVVVAENNGVANDIYAMRISASGTVLDPPTRSLVEETYFMRFGTRLAYAGGVFLLTFDESNQTAALRFDSNLNKLDSTPFVLLDRTIADLESNGTDFYIAWNQQRPDFSSVVSGSRVSIAGVKLDGNGVEISGSFSPQGSNSAIAVAWDGFDWRVTWPNSGATRVARVNASGQVLQPGGLALAGVVAGVTAGTGTHGLQVAWPEFNDNEYDVFAATIDTSSAVISNAGVALAAPRQNRTDLAAGLNGYMAVYRSSVAGQARVLAQPLDAGGNSTTLEPVELDSGSISSGPGSPAIAWNGSVFLVSWASPAGIVARRMSETGTLLDPTPLLVMNPGFGAVDVAAVGDDFLVAGRRFGQTTQLIFPIGARVSGNGVVLDAEPILLGSQSQSPYTTYTRTLALTALNDRWLAAWHTNVTHDNPLASTVGTFIDTNGTATAPFLMHNSFSTSGGNGIFQLALGSDGSRAIMVQSSELISGVETDLLAHVIAADGTVGATLNLTPWAGNQYRPEISFDGSDYLLVFQDQRSRLARHTLDQLDARSDLYGMRIRPDGTNIDPQGFLISNSAIAETDPNAASRGSDTLIIASQMLNDGVHSAYRALLSEVLDGSDSFPVAVASASTVEGDVPLGVSFNSSGSVDPEGTLLSYLWQFADGSSSTAANPSHTYTMVGEYPVILTVFDSPGQASSQTIMINARAPNQLPVAMATASRLSGPAPLSTTLFANGSYDPDGHMGNIEWRSSNGGSYFGSPAYFSFSNEGSYTVTLKVYDSHGAFAEETLGIEVGGANQPPVAQVSVTPTSGDAPLTVQFSSTGSNDPDGSIVSYNWNFGDGASSTSTNPAHLYTSIGTYTATLTVTDNSGASATASAVITVNAVSAASLRTAISMSGSKKRGVESVKAVVVVSNGDGGVERSAIVTGRWTLPDGSSFGRSEYSDRKGKASFSTVANADGVYAFTILNVTKAGFAWDITGSETSDSFTVGTIGGNQSPTAVFSDSCSLLSCGFDATASSDPDGTITSYSWNFGDGNIASGASLNHDYAAAGSYTVNLTVIDDQGATGNSSRNITVNNDPIPTRVIHVGDLDGSSANAARGRWQASVLLRLHDANDDPVADMTVSGSWSNGAKGSGSCVTNADGSCVLSKSNIKGNVSSVVLTVSSATGTNVIYDSAANHDPDGDSNGNTIIVNKP